MAKKTAKPKVIPLRDDEWKSNFHTYAMRTSFCLALTQPMLEFLCATADGVDWDRSLYYQQYGLSKPDSFASTAPALEKRGLITSCHKDKDVIDRRNAASNSDDFNRVYEIALWRLTPAGEKVVELLKVAGVFIEADAAISKRSRKA